MAAVVSISSSSSSCHLFHHLLRQQKTPSSPSVLPRFFLKPLSISSIAYTTYPHIEKPQPNKTLFHRIPSSISQHSPFHTFSLFPLSSAPTKSLLRSLSSVQEPVEDIQLSSSLQDEEEEDGEEIEKEEEDDDEEESEQDVENYHLESRLKEDGLEDFEGEDEEEEVLHAVKSVSVVESVEKDLNDKKNVKEAVNLPTLTVKEKKDLASYAHSLGDKLKCQLVGKSGVTDTVVSSFIENLEKNELLKIKIHRTCAGELEDVVKHLEKATGSIVVSQIGRAVIVYRPSLTKMKAEEKKRQVRKVYVRKEREWKPTLMQKAQSARISGRGQRGSSKANTFEKI